MKKMLTLLSLLIVPAAMAQKAPQVSASEPEVDSTKLGTAYFSAMVDDPTRNPMAQPEPGPEEHHYSDMVEDDF